MTNLTTSLIAPAPRISIDCMGRGEVVFFLHGVGGNKTNWRENLAVFGKHFRAIAWDSRGYGDSDDYDAALEFSDFADDLARVLAVLKVEKVHLVGLSMGSWIAMDFALRYPEHLHSLTLCCTHAGFSYLSADAKAEFIRRRKEPLLRGLLPADIAEPVARSLVSPKAEEAVVAKLAASMAALHRDSYLKSIEALIETDFRAQLGAIDIPCLVVSGSDDPLTTKEMGQEVSDLIKGAQFVVIPDAGHLPNLEQPAAFNDAVLGFLRSVDP